MDTKVAKITRSWTSPDMSSLTALREPSLSRRIPSRRSGEVFLIVFGLRRALRTLSVFASKPGRPDGRHRIPHLRQ